MNQEFIADGRDTDEEIPLQFDEPEQSPPAFDPFRIPYASVLSFERVVRKVRELEGEATAGVRLLARELLRRVEEVPAFNKPIQDLGVVARHRDLFDLMLLFLVAPDARRRKYIKLTRAFDMRPLYLSNPLRDLMGAKDACYTFNAGASEVWKNHLVMVGSTILRQCYGVDVQIEPSAMLTVPDPETGLTRFYKPVYNHDYVEVRVNGDLPDLSEQQIQRLLDNIHDTGLWQKHLPAEVFSFHGFHLTELHDVTTEESLSRLKHRLISRDAVLDVERVKELANLVRLHFQLPHLQLGLTAVDYPRDRAVDHEYRIRYNLLSDEIASLTDPAYAGSAYEHVFRTGEMLVIQDLMERQNPTLLEERLIDLGYRSLLLAPLLSQDKHVIGIVELASPHPHALNAFMEARFEEIRGLFRTAVERSREYINNRIEVIMREQYTSLHPTVEWKFTEAAFDILKRQEEGLPPAAEEIRFQRVYPLYGQADIVGSSNLRNAAIYQDLVDNLRAGRLVLVRALDLVDFPIVNQVVMSLDIHLRTSLDAFDNGHEIRMGDFIHRQLSPLVEQLGHQLPELHELASRYADDLDPELGLFYRVRRDYEKSVVELNRTIGNFLSERDQAAQRVLPHYFEKYKTDGVEYELYVGQSLLKQQRFTDLHLRNLRLSQLVDMCQLTRVVAELSPQLPMPLRTAQLIFAFTSPLDIRFRMDEKRFDVDGDYNVRYEILKKRIDKATVRQGQERLTQPGMVSIVYMQDRDLEEYEEYLRYLHQSDYIDGEVEYLTLDPLQSVNGLNALRFRVRA